VTAGEVIAAVRIEPRRARVALGSWVGDEPAAGTRVRIEIGNASFEGRVVGRGFVCSPDACDVELAIDFGQDDLLEAFLDTWRVVGAGRLELA